MQRHGVCYEHANTPCIRRHLEADTLMACLPQRAGVLSGLLLWTQRSALPMSLPQLHAHLHSLLQQHSAPLGGLRGEAVLHRCCAELLVCVDELWVQEGLPPVQPQQLHTCALSAKLCTYAGQSKQCAAGASGLA